jgi:hypothetical protein
MVSKWEVHNFSDLVSAVWWKKVNIVHHLQDLVYENDMKHVQYSEKSDGFHCKCHVWMEEGDCSICEEGNLDWD